MNLMEMFYCTKPKWIPGAPTKPGWCWLKNTNGAYIENIARIDNDAYYTHDSCVRYFEYILAHCPIEEPEE